MSRLSLNLWLLLLLAAPGAILVAGEESLFDDDEVDAWKKQQAEEEEFVEDKSKWVNFTSKDGFLTANMVFDERGKLAEGGPAELAFYHVAEFNGEIIDEPTEGSEKLMAAIKEGSEYQVSLAPPSLGQFQCTEKVIGIAKLFEEEYSHEFDEALLERARKALEEEGVVNSKQLGELEEKDYDEIRLPAIIKSKLRKVRAEARKQSEVAGHHVELDGAEVQAELDQFMNARKQTAGGEAAPEAAKAAEATTASSEAAGEGEEEDGTFKSLVWAVMNCPTCKGKETIACFRNCRYNTVLGGEKKVKSWSECLDECLENRWLRATFRAMLPSEGGSMFR